MVRPGVRIVWESFGPFYKSARAKAQAQFVPIGPDALGLEARYCMYNPPLTFKVSPVM